MIKDRRSIADYLRTVEITARDNMSSSFNWSCAETRVHSRHNVFSVVSYKQEVNRPYKRLRVSACGTSCPLLSWRIGVRWRFTYSLQRKWDSTMMTDDQSQNILNNNCSTIETKDKWTSSMRPIVCICFNPFQFVVIFNFFFFIILLVD